MSMSHEQLRMRNGVTGACCTDLSLTGTIGFHLDSSMKEPTTRNHAEDAVQTAAGRGCLHRRLAGVEPLPRAARCGAAAVARGRRT
eukprot:4710726-Pleurochrysis_carterae.AAC.1